MFRASLLPVLFAEASRRGRHYGPGRLDFVAHTITHILLVYFDIRGAFELTSPLSLTRYLVHTTIGYGKQGFPSA